MSDESNHPYKPRKLSDLSLIDDFLFGLFIQDADRELIRRMLEIILDMKIVGIEMIERQHNIKNNPEKHSITLDAMIKDDKEILYNIEVQASRIKSVPKRMRYHQSLIDREQMPAGCFAYEKLPKTIIVTIADYDVFDRGFFRYTFQNLCMEDKSLLLGDDTYKIVLNTKGHVHNGESEELIELLRFFHDSDHETAKKSKSRFVRDLDETLIPIKNNPEYGGRFMSFEELIYEQQMIAEERGEASGEAKGREEGAIKGSIETYFDCGKSFDDTLAKIIQKFSLSSEKANEYMKLYYPAAD